MCMHHLGPLWCCFSRGGCHLATGPQLLSKGSSLHCSSWSLLTSHNCAVSSAPHLQVCQALHRLFDSSQLAHGAGPTLAFCTLSHMPRASQGAHNRLADVCDAGFGWVVRSQHCIEDGSAVNLVPCCMKLHTAACAVSHKAVLLCTHSSHGIGQSDK